MPLFRRCDGRLIRDEAPSRMIMPYLMRGRNESLILHEARYDIQAEAENTHRYLESLRWQIAAIAHAHGYKDIHDMSRDDLVALTPEAAEITGLPYAPEYRERDEGLQEAS